MTLKVLVTAGANGIGLAIAKAFAANGARVHIADIDEQALQAVRGGNISGTVADVSDAVEVKKLMADVVANLDGLDVLVNNAGIAGPTAPVAEYDLAAWQAVLDVNLTGTFQVTRLAIPLLVKSKQASIIIMSSLAGRVGYPNRCAYATTKWGLVGFAKTLALELGPLGITCNTIMPGAVAGERMMKIVEGRAQASGRSVEQELEGVLANQSIKQLADPEDIAALALFLTGRHARTISGQSFPIDGDSKAAQ